MMKNLTGGVSPAKQGELKPLITKKTTTTKTGSGTLKPLITKNTDLSKFTKGKFKKKRGTVKMNKAIEKTSQLSKIKIDTSKFKKEEEPHHEATHSTLPFKLKSGNTTSFKEMGSSPATFMGVGGFNPSSRGSWITRLTERMRAKKEARRAKRAAGGGFGGIFGGRKRVGAIPHGDEAHTGGGGGGGAIGGAPQLPVEEALPPEMEGEEEGMSNLASDIRLKENVNKTGVSPSGIPIYEFNYIGDSNRYSGAMAQDLLETNPDAVSMDTSGYYRVNYSNIDVDMHLLN